MSAGEIIPIALGIITDPPTLVLTYDEVVAPSSKAQRRQRRMPIRYTPPPFTDRSKVDYAHFLLKQKHGPYLPEVTQVLVPKLLRVVQELMKGMEIKEALAKVDSEYSVDPDKDLNKVSSAELAQNKLIMDEDFLRKRIKPSDKDYVYDKVEDFETGGVKQRSEWDDDDDNNNDNDKEDDKAKISEDSVKVSKEDVNLSIAPVETKPDPKPSLHEESLVETVPAYPSLPEKVEPSEDQVSFEEQLLVSICDGEIEDDKLLSICDFDISLPFGDGENIIFGMPPEITRDENETREESQRNRVYMPSESDNDDDDKDTSKVVLKMAPHTVIDIGNSAFLGDVSTFLREEIDDDIPSIIPYPPPPTDLPFLRREEENNQKKTLEKVKIVQDFKDIETPEKVRIAAEFNKKETPEKVRIVEEFLKIPSEKQVKVIPGESTKEKVVDETKLTDDKVIPKPVPDSDHLGKIEKPKLLEDDDDEFWGL